MDTASKPAADSAADTDADSRGSWGEEWDRVVDVVVVGGGAAGATAAAVATAEGASVALLEKASFTGGTTAKSGGVMWIPDNPLLRERGEVDDREAALRYMARTAFPTLYDAQDPTLGLPADRHRLLEAFFDGGSAAVAHLVELGALEVETVDYPDYYAHLPEGTATTGRVLQPVLPDDWTPGRDATGGQILVDDLLRFAQDRGAQVLVDHAVDQVVRNEAEEVVGVLAYVGRRPVLVGARQGVVFASGGFLHDPRLVLDHLRGPVFGGAAAETATGDLVRIATGIGAQLGNMAHAWWDQVAVEVTARTRSTSADVYSPFGDSMLMVNRFGRRAVNEKAPYNERAQAHFVWDPYRGEYPNYLLFMIFDDAVVEDPERSIFRWPVPTSRRPRDYVIAAQTFEELADKLGRRLERLASLTGGAQLDASFLTNLHATVERFNQMAADGEDSDFRRGETPIEQVWAGEPRPGAASAAMYPLASSGPYYCVILGPGALDTKGGPVTDEHARILSGGGEPIPGLYGAGNCVASLAGQAYWGPGGTIGPAVAFGYLAARHAVGQPARSPA